MAGAISQAPRCIAYDLSQLTHENCPGLPDTLLYSLSQEPHMLRERADDSSLSGRGLLRWWPKAVQPNKEVPKHVQRVLLTGLHHVAKAVCLAHRIRGILELEIPPVERDGVVEEELRSVFETLRECVGREILKERVRGVGKEEGNFVGQGFGEDGG